MRRVKKWGDVIDRIYNKMLEKRDNSVKNLSARTLVLIKIFAFSAVLTCFTSFILGTKEFIQGNYPLYKKMADGAICNDGWKSHSQGPGTCAWHRGVDHYIYKEVNIGIHKADPEPYYRIGAITTSLLIIPSLLWDGYRWLIVRYVVGLFYWTGTVVASLLPLLFIVVMPFYIVYFLVIPPRKRV